MCVLFNSTVIFMYEGCGSPKLTRVFSAVTWIQTRCVVLYLACSGSNTYCDIT